MATRRLTATIDLISHLVSGNSQESAVSQAILDKSTIAGEAYVDAIRAALTTPATTPAEEATRTAIAAGYDRRGSVDAPQAILRTIPPRVYVHVPIGSNWDAEVGRIRPILSSLGMIVMPTVKVSQRPPDRTNIRYYESADGSETDKGEAEKIVDAVKDTIPALNTMPSRIPFSAGVRPRHYEIWFSQR